MSPELIALGKRAVACPRWRWVAGMLVYALPDEPDDIGASGITLAAGERPRVVSVRDGCVTLAWEAGAGDAEGGTLLLDDIPDLSDPATLGCLLALVREAHKEPTAHPLPCENDRAVWHIERLNASEAEWLRLDGAWGGGVGLADPIAAFSEAEALVAALEGAP